MLFNTPNPVPRGAVTSLRDGFGEGRVRPCSPANHPAQDGARNGEQEGLIAEKLTCLDNSPLLRDKEGLNSTCC